MFDMIAEGLYYAVDSLYMQLFEFLLTHWDLSIMAMNNGQVVITLNSLYPTVEQWLDEAQDDWPYADADVYAYYCFTAYDYQVTERAFSDTIERPVPEMWEIIDRAIMLYELAQMFEVMAATT